MVAPYHSLPLVQCCWYICKQAALLLAAAFATFTYGLCTLFFVARLMKWEYLALACTRCGGFLHLNKKARNGSSTASSAHRGTSVCCAEAGCMACLRSKYRARRQPLEV
jgi:hypothetical protein